MSVTKTIDSYLNSSSDISVLLLNLNAEVEDHNLILSDLDHFLELEDLEPAHADKVTSFRKATLVARRSAKDKIRVIDQILPKQIEGRTTQDRYEHAIRNLGARVYTPRKIQLTDITGE